MTRFGWSTSLFVIVVIFAALGWPSLVNDALFLDRDEADILHLADITLRFAEGQVPHRDFVTPIGFASFLPAAALVAGGEGIGSALLRGQVIFALMLLPMTLWVARSRFEPHLGAGFAISVLILLLAVVPGGVQPELSFSGYSDRWNWALAFLAITLVALPRQLARGARLDGLVLGLVAAFFLLSQIAFAIAFIPALVVALVLRGDRRVLATSGYVFAGVLGLATLALGPGFWIAYLGDLNFAELAGSGGLGAVLWSPLFLIGNLCLIAAIILLRRGIDAELGRVLFLLAPGFAFAGLFGTGTDPKWSMLLGLILLASAAAKASVALRNAGLIAIALALPSFANMATSPWRHAILPDAAYVASFERAPHSDLFMRKSRAFTVTTRALQQFEGAEHAWLNAEARAAGPVIWQGQELPHCLQQTGMIGTFQAIARDLDATKLAEDRGVFVADLLNSLWMFGETKPLKTGAPRYSGGLAGLRDAEFLLIPTCPVSPSAMRAILSDLTSAQEQWTELRRTELYSLFVRS